MVEANIRGDGMQVRPLKGESNRLYLTEEEYQLVLDQFVPALEEKYERVNNHRRFRTGSRVMGEAGFRFDGLDQLEYGASYVPIDERVEIAFARIYEGKDPTGEFDGGKRRDTWIRESLMEEIEEHAEDRGISEGTELFTFSYDQFRKRVKAVGEFLAKKTGNDDWDDLRPHDFRARFANELVEAGVPDTVIMWLGGWTDETTYKTKYKKPLLSHEIQSQLALSGVLDVDVEVPESQKPIEHQILERLSAVEEMVAEIQNTVDDPQ